MAKLVGPALSLDASKSMKKTLTFQRTPSGNKIYKWMKPGGRAPFIVSSAQLAQRALYQTAVTAWNALSSAQKAGYETLAKSLGYLGTGYNYFLRQQLSAVIPAPPVPPSFIVTGGLVTYFGLYTLHTFLTSDDCVITGSGDIDVLVVPGGGGAGNGSGANGGGGAGKPLLEMSYAVTDGTYPVDVGDGGALGVKGEDSFFGLLQAFGGGYGGSYNNGNGSNGGTGGGASGGYPAYSAIPGVGLQGQNGGNGSTGGGSHPLGGGGGGDKESGKNAGAALPGNGGDGIDYSAFFGTTYGESGVFSGGGGGGGWNGAWEIVGIGGLGGGGNTSSIVSTAGMPNTGGGGGSDIYGGTNHIGGSGIVIVRHLT